MRCPSPYWWILLEPPGTPRILLDVPHPQYLKCMAALVGLQVPHPFHTFYSHALGCVGMRCHSPYYWKLLEPPGTPRILLDVPHWCAGPPSPFIHFIPMLWGLLACVALLHTGGYYWNHLELLDVPHPKYLKCMAALVCRSPPLSYILFPCSGLCWHALPFSLLLETIGTTWNS